MVPASSERLKHHGHLNSLITLRGVTAVGGLCYTIYLTHFQLMSAFEKALGGASFANYFPLNLLLHPRLLAPVLLAAGRGLC